MTLQPNRSISALVILSLSMALARGVPQGAQQSPMGGQLPEGDPRPFELVPPPPRLLSGHSALTEATSIVITGQALQAIVVMVQAPALKKPLLVNPSPGFSIEVPLNLDQLNQIVFTSLSLTNTASAPTVAAVIQDGTPPELIEIDQPLDGTQSTSATVAVSGRVGDGLAGMEGMVVTVSNGSTDFPANLTPGSATTGSFLATGVTLDAIDTPTTITATATDALDHEAFSVPITVTRVAVPAAVPELQITSPTGSLMGEVGMELAQALTVQVTTDGSTPFEGKVVTFEVVAGGGLLADSPMGVGAGIIGVPTDASGNASVYWTLGSEPGSGNQCVLVSSVGVVGGGTYCAIALAGTSDAQINITQGNDQLGEVGSVAALPLRVRLSNNGGPIGPLDSGEVTFEVVTGDGSFVGNPDPVDVLTDASGHAEVNFRYGVTPGLNRIEVAIKNPIPATSPVAVFNLEGFVRDTAQGTSLTGLVLDNADEPIQGATVRLSDNGLLLVSTTSDISGRFDLSGIAQGGAYDLDIDGASATFVGGPDGSSVAMGSFPALHFDVIVVTGVTNEQPSPIYLPFLDPVNARQFDNTKDVILTVAGVEGLEMLVRAGSMTNPDGSTPSMGNATTISLNQVQFDKVAMPFPDGADNRIAWTLQPAGATFAPPIEVRVPNVAGLAPGTLGHILSFDHDVVAFVATATAGVTNGGEVLETDPDAGIDVSGWGGFCPPFHAFFDLSIASVTPGTEIPVTTELPVPGGVVRSDDCGHGRFGAPRGTDLHAGIDLIGTAGVTDVVSVYDGTVIAVESGCTTSVMCTDAEFACGGGYGNFVVVEHTTTDVPAATVTFYTAYAHLDSVDMSIMEGSLVTAGSTVLGKLGQSGNANPDCFSGCTITPFVHFEISPVIPPLNGFGAVTDPEPYLSMLSLPYPAAVSQTSTTRTLDGNYAASFVLRGLGRTGVAIGEPFPGSLYEVNNVPLTDPDQVTLQGTWLVGESLEQSYASDFMTITDALAHTTVTVPSLARTTGQPETLDLTSPVSVLDTTMGAMMTQLSAKVADQTGMTTDVTTGLGTVYASSNDAILEIDQSGLAMVPAGGSIGGTAILSASNEGISATVSVDVIVASSLTTVYGFVTRGGVLTSGVSVTALPGNGSATTTAGLQPTPLGQFVIEDVPADQGLLTLIAELDDMGTLVAGAGTSVMPVPGGNTDAGIIEISDAKVWIGGTGNWEVPRNWSPVGVPTMTDFAIINVGGGDVVTVNDVRAVAGLHCEESLVIASGGSLEVLSPFQVNNTFQLDGGALLNCTVMAGSGGQELGVTASGGTLNGVTLIADATVADTATLTVRNGLVLEGTLHVAACTVNFVQAQELSGSGEVDLAAPGVAPRTLFRSGSGTLTIGEDMTVRGASATFGSSGDSFLNRGLVQADLGSGGTGSIEFRGTLENRGIMRALTAMLFLRIVVLENYGLIELHPSMHFGGPDDTWLNAGTITSDGANLLLNAVNNQGLVTVGGGLTLGLGYQGGLGGGPWSNEHGVIQVNANVNVTLFDDFTLTDLGNIIITRGSVRLEGSIDLEGGTLGINGGIDWYIHEGSRIENGQIDGIDGGRFFMRVFGSGTPVTATLAGVTTNCNWWVGTGSTAIIEDGLTVNGITRVPEGEVRFMGTSSLDGSGEILVTTGGSGEAQLLNPTGTLTIEPGVTITGTVRTLRIGSPGQSFINRGTIRADSLGGSLVLDGNGWINEGLIEILPGSVPIKSRAAGSGIALETYGSWTNAAAGVINSNMSVLELNTFDMAGTWSNLGTISATNSIVDIAGNVEYDETGSFDLPTGFVRVYGDVDLNGGTLDLDTAGGNWMLNGGSFTSGTIDGTVSTPLTATVSGGTLDAVGLSGVLEVPAGTGVSVTNTLSLDGTIDLQGGTVTATAGPIDILGGLVSGDGTLAGAVSNAGFIQPGGSNTAGAITIDGTYSQAGTGVLELELGGLTPVTQHDQLNVIGIPGSAALNGVIDLALISAFTPTPTDTFDVLDSVSLTAAFADVDAPGLTTGLQVDHSLTAVQLTALDAAAGLWATSIVDTGTPRLNSDLTTSAIRVVDSLTILIAYLDEDDQLIEFAKSTNGGLTWTHTLVDDLSGGGAGIGFVTMDCGDASTYFVGYSAGANNGDELTVAVSTNGGALPWTAAKVRGDSLHSSLVATGPDDAVVGYVHSGNDPSLGDTVDGGDSWSNRSVDSAGTGIYTSLVGVNSSTFVIGFKGLGGGGGDEGPIVGVTTDGIDGDWDHVEVTGSSNQGDFMTVASLDGTTIFAAFHDDSTEDLEFARSVDAGVTWPLQVSVDSVGMTGRYLDLIAINSMDLFLSFHHTGNGELKVGRSDDGGVAWDSFVIDATSADIGEGTSIDALDADSVFISYYDQANELLKLARSIPR